ncbi:MAG: PEP-utilizing enzyme [Candidatus Micrarchaeota archaeon]
MKWFQWERQATVLPIIMCMRAWEKPMTNAYGKCWPTTVIIYNNDIVGWYNKWEELLHYGQYLIETFTKKIDMDEFEQELKKQTEKFDLEFKKLDETNLRMLSDNEIIETYKRIEQMWTEWFVPGGLVEPVGHQGERILERITNNDKKAISLLTSTNRESFSKRELRGMLEILIAKKTERDLDDLIENHVKKYYWIHNNYFTTEVLDRQFFLNELKNIEEKYPEPEEQIKAMDDEIEKTNREKEKLIETLKLGEKDKKLIRLLDMFSWYQDYRKEYIMQLLHYLDWIVAEVGARKGISLKEMKYALPEEIITGRLDREKMQERMKRFIYNWNFEHNKSEFGSGLFAVEKEKQIFHEISHSDDITEVSGMVANKGIVRGVARITMSAKEAGQIKKGEILITSMTTPDFVTAMKRAGAIVTNEGGVLCHAAIVSRELNLPCIVGTRIATKIFKNGDMIEVDGNLGVVRKIDK